MATKKNIKVRDLKPSKDAKGGGSTQSTGVQGYGTQSTGTQSTGAQGTKEQRHHHHRER